ncbi:hemolysin III family protein [Robertkochia marina]|uniref:Hemolysin III family protein n=1 Tax=Robertkochia marina TaxID=1227945 RepID=A0A4S3LYK9_9FLAO|nr:hemolysin III family protein [Robertkochia marina]THD66506.1 hemolysin III family protein [Robertkochia marina]TRZ45655.1 hemolysin III family protein [Robertkochia marina]
MHQSLQEEKLNAITHGFGAAMALIGLLVLVYFDTGKTSYSTFSIIVYGLSALLLFTISTLYHSARRPAIKNLFRLLDHIAIYFLIAGTYTPIGLISMEQGSGWVMFTVVWVIALIGSVFKIFFLGKYERLSLLFYLFMGWLVLFDLRGLFESLSKEALILLLIGGAFYTVGTLFYRARKMRYHHVIWHLFVLGGAVSHFFMILFEI